MNDNSISDSFMPQNSFQTLAFILPYTAALFERILESDWPHGHGYMNVLLRMCYHFYSNTIITRVIHMGLGLKMPNNEHMKSIL